MSVCQTSKIEINNFGSLPNNPHEIVRRYTLKNKNNAYVRLITLGAGIQSITLPNKNGDMADIVLGFDNIIGYLKNRYIGRIVGRELYSLEKQSDNYVIKKNIKDHCSFDIVNWNSYILDNQVVMTHISRNYSKEDSGDLLTQVKYAWTDDNQLHMEIYGMCTKPYPVCVSSHCLFNLAGHNMGAKELKSHVVTMNADHWLQLNMKIDASVGSIEKLYKKICNLYYPTPLHKKTLYRLPSGDYNHSTYISDSNSTWYYRFHARILHPMTGRYLEVYSNYPTLYMYTGIDLPNPEKTNPPDIENYRYSMEQVSIRKKIIGKQGILYKRHGSFGLIPQGYLKELNCDRHSIDVLYPGKIYSLHITYKFGVVM